MLRVVPVIFISVASACLVTVLSSSALSSSSLVKDVTSPLSNFLFKDAEKTPSNQPTPDQSEPPTPVSETDSGSTQSPPSPSTEPAARSSTGEQETAPLTVPEQKQTTSQIAPPPTTAMSEQLSYRVPAFSSVLASILTLDRQDSTETAIQRTTGGWKLGGMLWYWWLFIVAVLVMAVALLKYHWTWFRNRVSFGKR